MCVPSTFAGRAGFDVDASHVFPQDVLAAGTLVWGGAGEGGVMLEFGVKRNFLSAQWLSPLYGEGRVCSPVAGAEALRVWPERVLFSFSICFSLSRHQDPCCRKASAEKVGPMRRQRSGCSGTRGSAQMSLGGKSPLSPTVDHYFQPPPLSSVMELFLRASRACTDSQHVLGVHCGGVAALRNLGGF